MKEWTVLSLVACAGLLAACSTSPTMHSSANSDPAETPPTAYTNTQPDTVLLVSLEDGSVIMQKITSSADICFKNNSDSATTCLTKGAPITSPETSAVIGFEMIEERIDLVAKSN